MRLRFSWLRYKIKGYPWRAYLINMRATEQEPASIWGLPEIRDPFWELANKNYSICESIGNAHA